MIGIIDYGSGNIAAISSIYDRLRISYFISSDPEKLREADRFILPGVGAFDSTMRKLVEHGLCEMLSEQILQKGKMILGVCVGMQIMAEASDEGDQKGLGWFQARVKRMDISKLSNKPFLPHMGWNDMTFRQQHPILKDIDPRRGFYFLHSYCFDCQDEADVLAETVYGSAFPSAVIKRNIFGFQFHPEKSHSNGTALFANFASI